MRQQQTVNRWSRPWRGRMRPLVALDAAPESSRGNKKPKTARAVQPNAGVGSWYTKQLQAAVRDMSESILLHIKAAWKEAEPQIGFAQDAPNSSGLLRKALEKWGGLWVGKLDKISQTLADRFAEKAKRATDIGVASSFRDAGFTVQFKPTQPMREAYSAVVGQNVGLIKSIPQQYLKDVETAVWQNVMKGGDLASLSKVIQDQYGKAYRRAALIATDQNAKAKAVFEDTRRKELGVTEGIWQHSHAGKEPRPTHVKMNGKRYKIGVGMYDSAVGRNVWPGELIKCRCTSRAVLPGFD